MYVYMGAAILCNKVALTIWPIEGGSALCFKGICGASEEKKSGGFLSFFKAVSKVLGTDLITSGF